MDFFLARFQEILAHRLVVFFVKYQNVFSFQTTHQVCAEMTLYVLHESHLYASANDLVQKETMTALESVIPRGSIAPFISQKVFSPRPVFFFFFFVGNILFLHPHTLLSG